MIMSQVWITGLQLKNLRVSEVALWMCFYNLTSLFFSIWPSDFEKTLTDEIWGCVKYVGIPYDTVMKMPIHVRKYFIKKHNEEQESRNGGYNSSTRHISGEALNEYASMEQSNNQRQRR